jgi:putative AbiEii toxin of type IV toxin-antitoxin system
LSPAGNRSHRTYLAKTPFKSFSVSLSNGDQVTATKAGDLLGDFSIKVTRNRRIAFIQEYPTNSRGIVPRYEKIIRERIILDDDEEVFVEVGSQSDEVDSQSEDRYLEYLKNIKIRPYFLTDDRKFSSDHLVVSRREATYKTPGDPPGDEDERPGLATELRQAFRRADRFLRQQALSGTDQGSQGADAIYLEVLHQLARTSKPINVEPSLSAVRDRIVELGNRTARFSEFGLVPHVSPDPFLRMLKNVSSDRVPLIDDVLTPYLDGQGARLSSLQPTEEMIRTFVETVNEFLVGKSLTYSLRQGIRITSQNGMALTPQRLSSGERQILLLLCNALLARDENALFIIDEPEISLNAKWQRKLIPALLACVGSSNVQFVLATHSVEIISGHREYLAQLRERSTGR